MNEHARAGRDHRHQEGQLLIEAMFAMAIAAIAVMGTLAMVPTTIAVNRAAHEHAAARNAAQARLAELQVLTLDDFRATFLPPQPGAPSPGADLFTFSVATLPLVKDAAAHGQVTITPDPVTQPDQFADASTYDVVLEVRWAAVGGDQRARFAVKLSPPRVLPNDPNRAPQGYGHGPSLVAGRSGGGSGATGAQL